MPSTTSTPATRRVAIDGADQFDRDFDEYEVETEEAGPMYQLIARYSF